MGEGQRLCLGPSDILHRFQLLHLPQHHHRGVREAPGRSCKLRADARRTGDFNAKAFMWGSAVEDAKGGMLANWAAAMNLVAMNRGEPTFERGGSRSVLDVTFCSPDIARRIQGWHVMEAGMTTSDHLPIEFTIRASHSLLEVGRPARGWRWTDSKKDELAALLRRKLEHLSSARLSLRSLIFCIFYKIY
jgi:hypothetical protein